MEAAVKRVSSRPKHIDLFLTDYLTVSQESGVKTLTDAGMYGMGADPRLGGNLILGSFERADKEHEPSLDLTLDSDCHKIKD
jgi:hypothetical protein